MTQDQIMALVRAVLISVGSGLVTNGYLTAGQSEAIVGGVVAVAAVAWSLWHHAGVNKADAVKAAGGKELVKAEVKAGIV